MKKYTMTVLALVTMIAGASLNAENAPCAAQCAQKAQVEASATAVKVSDTVASKLTAEEQSFAAKLNDQNRKAFSDTLTVEQRKDAMITAKASTADEAVAKLLNGSVVVSEKTEAVDAHKVK